MVLRTSRRLCRSPFLALVISFSACGRSARARDSVVVIRPCSKSWLARFARIRRWWAGLPPRRGPFVGLGIGLSLLPSRTRYWGRCNGRGTRPPGSRSRPQPPTGPGRSPGRAGTGRGPVRSVLLVLDERVVVVVAVRRQGRVRVEAGRAVLEG